MADVVRLLWEFVLDCLRSPEQLKAQNAVLHHQLNILRRKTPKRPKLSNSDRVLLIRLYRIFPNIAGAVSYTHLVAGMMGAAALLLTLAVLASSPVRALAGDLAAIKAASNLDNDPQDAKAVAAV